MIKSGNRGWLLVLAACGIVVSACGTAKDDEASILRFVPADTPYVFANIVPLPDAFHDKFEPKMDTLLEAYQRVILETVKSRVAEWPEGEGEDQGDSEESQHLIALAEELSSLFSVAAIRQAGIGRDTTFAMYGNGLLPVLRLQLTDAVAFEAAIARIEEQSGVQLAVAELDGRTYRYVDLHEARVVIAVFGDQAVFTVAPAAFDDEKLSQLVGLTLPAQSIAASGELQEIAQKYGFVSNYLGLLSMEHLAGIFLDAPGGLDEDIFALMDRDVMEISEICKAEIRSLVEVMPRMILGYKRIDVERIDSSVILELREDIAAGLSMLPAAVPGLGEDHGGMMSFGMSLNPKAAREFYSARLDAMEADPYECGLLEGLQAGVAKGREALNQPLPPMVYDFKGFLAIIDAIEGMDFATNSPPTSVSARMLLAMDNVHALVAMGAMFRPELAELNLQPDGQPVRLDLQPMNDSFEDPLVAMSESALGVSVGDDAAAKLTAMLAGAVDERPPFMSVVIDAGRYYAFVGQAIAAGNNGDDEAPVAVQQAVQDALQAVSNLYERMAMDVRFTSRGVEIDGTVTIAD